MNDLTNLKIDIFAHTAVHMNTKPSSITCKEGPVLCWWILQGLIAPLCVDARTFVRARYSLSGIETPVRRTVDATGALRDYICLTDPRVNMRCIESEFVKKTVS